MKNKVMFISVILVVFLSVVLMNKIMHKDDVKTYTREEITEDLCRELLRATRSTYSESSILTDFVDMDDVIFVGYVYAGTIGNNVLAFEKQPDQTYKVLYGEHRLQYANETYQSAAYNVNLESGNYYLWLCGRESVDSIKIIKEDVSEEMIKVESLPLLYVLPYHRIIPEVECYDEHGELLFSTTDER